MRRIEKTNKQSLIKFLIGIVREDYTGTIFRTPFIPKLTCHFKDCISSWVKNLPEIDLVLAGKDVKWRMRGGNLMVEIDEETTCLGFVDGGSEPRTSVVIGGHQLEENLLEFDLVSSQLRFSESLLFLNTSCSGI